MYFASIEILTQILKNTGHFSEILGTFPPIMKIYWTVLVKHRIGCNPETSPPNCLSHQYQHGRKKYSSKFNYFSEEKKNAIYDTNETAAYLFLVRVQQRHSNYLLIRTYIIKAGWIKREVSVHFFSISL